jgi:hypothetical protein
MIATTRRHDLHDDQREHHLGQQRHRAREPDHFLGSSARV